MRKTYTPRRIRFLLTGLPAVLLLAAAPLPGDSLWDLAVAQYGERMENHYPETAEETVQVLDKQGSPESETITVYHQSPGETNRIQRSVASSRKNGEDNTGEAKKKMKERRQKQAEEGEEPFSEPTALNPLFPSLQEHITVNRRQNNTALENGRLYAVYDFVYTHPPSEKQKENGESGYHFPGTIWLQADIGLPEKLTFSMEPLPDRVKALEGTSYYRPCEAGFPVIRRSEHNLRIQAMVFIKKDISITTEYSDFVSLDP